MLNTLLAQANFGGGFEPVTDNFNKGSGTDASGVTAASNLETTISSLIGALTLIAGLMFIFYFVMGGLNWITAGGEQGKIQKARDQMVQGVIGMIVVVISYGLIGLVARFVGLDLLHPGTVILNLSK
jgi:cytochrome bd-type quinol oxidase subunit 2